MPPQETPSDESARREDAISSRKDVEVPEVESHPRDVHPDHIAARRLSEVTDILASLDQLDSQISEARQLLAEVDRLSAEEEAQRGFDRYGLAESPVTAPEVLTIPIAELGELDAPSVSMPELFTELEFQRKAGLHRNACVSVYSGGEEILGYMSGEFGSGAVPDPKPLFRAFSSGKPMAAATVWRLLDAGVLEIDALVASYWPEFAQRGKSNVTLRHVLTHTAGLPVDFGRADVDWGDWGRMIDILASMPLEYEPGKVVHYHSITFGLLVAEIASRAAGVDFEELFEREVKLPLGLADTFFSIGADDHENSRRVQSLSTARDYGDPEMPQNMDWLLDNEIVSPGGSCITTASDLGRLYSVVSNGGVTSDGDAWLSESAAANVFATHALAYNIEQMTKVRVGQGVWMYDDQPNIVASPSGSVAFGHGGMGTSVGWGDPDHGVGVAIITDTMQEDDVNVRRLNRLSSAVRRDLGIPVGLVAEL